MISEQYVKLYEVNDQDTGATSVKIYIFSKKSKFVLKTETVKAPLKLQLFVERVIDNYVPIL